MSKQMEKEDWERVEQQASNWGEQALREKREDDRKSWRKETKTTSGKKRTTLAPGEQRRIKRRKYDIIEDDWGTQELQVRAPIDMVSPTIIKDRCILERTSQSKITDFVSVCLSVSVTPEVGNTTESAAENAQVNT